MKSICKRGFSVLLTLALLASCFSGLCLIADAAVGYNNGIRGKICTALSSQAKAYYPTGYDYETLSQLSGTTLETKLRTLMAEGYDGTNTYNYLGTMFQHTDAVNGTSGKMYCVYSGSSITKTTMNREHVWPKSLAPSFGEDGEQTGTGGADVLHLHPCDKTVNSTRSNKLFGEVTGGTFYTAYTTNGAVGGYYNGGYFEPLDAVKGDVARTILYVYTRWQERNLNKVFQSTDILLKWCELDPVDEFEMQRNDLCQQYVHSRNVYIDYPEYCWRVFGKTIPTHMTTPSGKGKTCSTPAYSSAITTQPTCTKNGVKTYTCAHCGYSYTEVVPATGHHYVNGKCEFCGAVQPTGEQYVLTDTLANGDKVVIYNANYKKVIGTERIVYQEKEELSAASATVTDNILKLTGSNPAIFTVSVKGSGSSKQYAFKNQNNQYMACEVANELCNISSLQNTAYWVLEDSGTGAFYLKNSTTKYQGYSEQYIEAFSSAFATYRLDASKVNIFAFQFYKLTDLGGCDHDYQVTATKSATCTEGGFTSYKCSKCSDVYTTYTDPLGHNFEFTMTVAPTAVEKGYDLYTCTRCAAEEQRNFTDPTGGSGGNPFVDVPSDAWYYSSVIWATSTDPKITSGIDATHFAPDNKCTRAEVVQFLWNAAGQPAIDGADNPFSDVSSSDWFYKAVLWAVREGITNGTTPTTFSPAKVCTRAEVVMFLWNAHGNPAPESLSIPFTDIAAGDWYVNAVLWAVERKVTSGTGDGSTFSPYNKCTRAQIVTFLYSDSKVS